MHSYLTCARVSFCPALSIAWPALAAVNGPDDVEPTSTTCISQGRHSISPSIPHWLAAMGRFLFGGIMMILPH
ncbi:hypothetical protein BS47DRAFT_440313 [Hydnum rufescens UP504]|uniref:Uncharacterized protein n=1 Tax=Hydnum rufescens UP504 TaxID=1448309 RepID=A0A9P6B5B4_9AGAM|nr:hypothetical protein BS47DRAFT_440313 [Hydnum rufescens UP504]